MLKQFDFGRRAALLATGLALLVLPTRAQVLDPTFAPLDSRASSPNSKGIAVDALANDAAGHVLMGGPFNLLNGQPRSGVQRLLANGQPDLTFGTGGVGTNGTVKTIWPLPNGQYLIGGTFTRYDGQAVGRMARLNANGTLDATFTAAGGSGANALVSTLATDGQGRILVGGYFDHFDGHAVPGLVRLLPSGAYDASFVAPVYGYEAYVYSLAVDASDRVIVGGDVYPDSVSQLITVLERLLPATGAADPSFVPDTLSAFAYDYITQLRLLPGGKVLIGGSLPLPSGYSSGIRRLNADGSTDLTFVSPFEEAFVDDMALLPNGQLLVAGSLYTTGRVSAGPVVRLQPNGTLDPSFVASPLLSYASVLLPGAAGSVLTGGGFTTMSGQAQSGLMHLTSTGALDASFTTPTFDVYATLNGLGRQSTDRLVIAGNFGTIGGQPVPPVVRVMASGAFDPSFQLDPTLVSSLNLTRNAQSSLIIGLGDRVLVTDRTHIYRLLPDGSRDPVFDDGSGPQSARQFDLGIRGAQTEPTGSVLVWGVFNRYNNQPRASLVRLTTTGAVDPSFVPPSDSTDFTGVIQAVPLTDETVAALYRFFNLPNYSLRWLDAAGTPLASFNGGVPLPGITAVFALSDSTLLVTGDFTLNNTRYQGTYKLDRTGTVDPRFVLAAGLSGRFVGEHNGLLLFRATVPGNHRLLGLLPNGAIAPSFTPVEFGTGYSGESDFAYTFQSTGDLVVAGGFTTVNGTQRPSLARLTNIPLGLRADASVARGLDLFPNPAHATLTLHRPTAEPATATLLDVLGRPVRCWTLTTAETRLPLTGIIPGTYAVRVTTAAGGAATRRVVVE